MTQAAIDQATARAEKLVKMMDLHELCGQLLHDAPAIPRLHIPAYNWWNEGLHGAARSGTATVFPQAIALAAMFDEKRMQEIGDIVATEQRAKHHAFAKKGDRGIYKGLSVWAPNINLFRDPRWGRGQETYGEDPLLTSRLAVAFIKGLQGDDPNVYKTAACVKHFVAHSGPEAERHHFNAKVSPKDLQESYLAAFYATVKEAGVSSVMGAYSALNGIPDCASPLIESLLRSTWGFQGIFISDCWAIRDFHEQHRITSHAEESAAAALKAGCDLNCGCTYAALEKAYAKGLLSRRDIEKACVRVMTIRILLGLLDEQSPYNDIPFTMIDCQEHADAALEAARRSIVLLKNEAQFLPLKAMKTVAVVGPNADSRAMLVGNYHGTPSREVTILEGIRNAMPDKRIIYAEGCALVKDKVERLASSGDRLAEAESACEASDCVILCLGLDESVEGEMHDDGNGGIAGDRKDLRLPLCQRQLLSAVARTGKPVVLLLASGGAIDPEIEQYPSVKALLQIWYPGQAGGTAVADLLVGRFCPSGKLPITFYRADTELPDFSDYSMRERTYRYFTGKPLYPFGFGLSYTKFLYEKGSAVEKEKGIELAVQVTNDGEMDGETTTFVTLSSPGEGMPKHSFLAAFEKTFLRRGETRTVSIFVSFERFCLVKEDGTKVMNSGPWTITVAPSVVDASEGQQICWKMKEKKTL